MAEQAASRTGRKYLVMHLRGLIVNVARSKPKIPHDSWCLLFKSYHITTFKCISRKDYDKKRFIQ